MLEHLGKLALEARESFALQNSMVSFIPRFLEQYASDQITLQQLVVQLDRAIQKAKFYFAHMPAEEVKQNQRLFQREFRLSDDLNAVLLQQSITDLDPEVVNRQIEECLIRYLESQKQ